MKICIYENQLPDQAKFIRETVFVEEQGFKEEFDTTDNISTHLVAYDGDKAAATCRFYQDDDGNYFLGRLAVLKEYRGKGVGAQLVNKAEECIMIRGGKELKLHSQLRAKPFYEKIGYNSFGEVDYDEDCKHIWMKKKL